MSCEVSTNYDLNTKNYFPFIANNLEKRATSPTKEQKRGAGTDAINTYFTRRSRPNASQTGLWETLSRGAMAKSYTNSNK